MHFVLTEHSCVFRCRLRLRRRRRLSIDLPVIVPIVSIAAAIIIAIVTISTLLFVRISRIIIATSHMWRNITRLTIQ